MKIDDIIKTCLDIGDLYVTNWEYDPTGKLLFEAAQLLREAQAANMLTADGKLITPGMKVWVPGRRPQDSPHDDGHWIIGSVDGGDSVIGWQLSKFRSCVGQPYSTRAAADAAANAAKAVGQ